MTDPHATTGAETTMTRVLDMLSSGVHDAKNQLFIAESLIVKAETEHGIVLDQARFAIEQAASRLTRVLTAYRLQRHLGQLSITLLGVRDLLDEAAVINGGHCRSLGLALDVDAPADLWWPLDRELSLDILSNALQNASRFARERIRLSATQEDGMLVLRVEDDGPGFESTDIDDMATRGLGLFVARELALLHTRNDRQGSLALYNGGCYGGAVFELRLP